MGYEADFFHFGIGNFDAFFNRQRGLYILQRKPLFKLFHFGP
jgi:hypothetical protein